MVLAALAVPALLALGVHLAAGSSLTSPPQAVARVSTEPLARPSRPLTTSTTTSTTEDISGPCDEAEHRNDPRCAPGASTTTTTRDDDDGSNRGRGSDNSGPGSDSSGRGRGRSGGDD
jgi:hypothetical protein